jgi:hypothetical protein
MSYAPDSGAKADIPETSENRKSTRVIGLWNIACIPPIARLSETFHQVGLAIDHLDIWQTPIVEQRRPWRVPVFAPHPKQRHAVVNLGALPEPAAGLATTPRLKAPQEPHFAAWRIPELPRDHASAVPPRVFVSRAAPEVDMPAEAVDRLPAHAAEAGAQGVYPFPIRRGRRSEGGRQSALAVVAQPPRPAIGCSGQGSKRSRQAIGANGRAANRNRSPAAGSAA